MTWFWDTSQFLSPAIPIIIQWAHEQNGYIRGDGGFTRAQQHALALTTAECPFCQQEIDTESLIWHCSPGRSAIYWWQLVCNKPLPSWKRQHFVLCIWICLPGMQCFYQNYLTECFIHCHGILHSIAADQGTQQKMKCSNGPMLMEFTGLTMFPPILKQLA